MKKKVLFIAVLMFFYVSYTQAQSYQAKLMKDMVTIANNKMTADDYTIITYSNGNSLQVKSHAEAPAQGIISRDNFVAMFTYLTTTMIDEMKKVDADATTKDLDEIIGNADVEINCFMAKGGIQVETKSSEGTERNTMKWEDFFRE